MPRMHEVGTAGEDIGLQRHAELPAIVDDAYMMVRDAPRSGVEPESLVEFAGLQHAVGFPKAVPAPQRQAAAADAAARLEHHAIEAGAIKLIGGAQAGDSRPKNGDGFAGAGILGQSKTGSHRRRGFEEIQRHQRLIGRAGTAQAGHGT